MPANDAEKSTLILSLEYVDPEELGVQSGSIAPDSMIATCAGILHDLALEPQHVRMVITGNFVQSVRDRMSNAEEAAAYDVGRNEGIVGGKTMDRTDGTIDVILQAVIFAVEGTSEELDSLRQIAIHTTTHEAQHVVMKQAGEDSADFAHLPFAKRWFAAIAHDIINEYRAEAAVPQSISLTEEGWDCAEVAANLIESLRTVDNGYQKSEDARALMEGVARHVGTLWKILGVIATERRQSNGAIESLPDAVVNDPGWETVVDDNWDALITILDEVPSATTRIAASELSERLDNLAETLESWLLDLGFRFEDSANGPAFYIVHRNLLG
ncbi:hypothetical protein [Aeromicrobium sp. P5_D10]